ncbi:hypothetical protein RCH09_001804, partial [Actimicrobium sp. GrIS 1.19]|uniref:hypothetical protein n=1 Tax=Actimicrobium sp. GrIS 1.19 TaxID=3071708 RepID=UPI002E0A8027|nr:hypothetical protein [Actimicrobium sp. GrIS 1.19]
VCSNRSHRSAFPSSAHTYRLLIVKELLPHSVPASINCTDRRYFMHQTKRFVCLQRRDEIMLLCYPVVNPFRYPISHRTA